jgi:antitoxin ParD1/3/4
MGTRNINLTDALDRFVDRQIESGAYQNASEVLRAGLRLLKAEQDVRAAKLRRLKAAIDEALGDLEAGRYEEVELGDLESWFDRVSAEADAEVARRRANRR